MNFTPLVKPEAPVGLRGDNIFGLLSNCAVIASRLDWPDRWVEEFRRHVLAQASYEEACAVIEEHFTIIDERERT